MDLNSVKSTSKAVVVVMSELVTAALAVGAALMFLPGPWAAWLNLV
jgi:hypothetical protein